MSTMHDTHVRAFPVEQKPDHRDLPDTYEKGRRCDEWGCITVLSIYNPGPYCYCHAAKHTVHLLANDVEPVDPFGPLFVPLYRAPVTH